MLWRFRAPHHCPQPQPICIRILLLFATVASAFLCVGAETTNLQKNAKNALVGNLGHKNALLFYSNQTFATEQIVDAMAYHFDYHAAAHPAAPLAGYLDCLAQKIQLGYQRAGFAKAAVEMHPDAKLTRIHAHITEGPRYRCGEIRITGMATNEAVREAIVEALQGIGPVAGSNPTLVQWTRNQPAPCDEIAQQLLIQQVVTALSQLNRFPLKVRLSMPLDPDRKVADLVIDIVDDGVKGTIEEIQFAGEIHSSQEKLLRFLDLKPSMDLRPDITSSVSNRLWQSGRFVRHEVHVSPLGRPGYFKLQINADELRDTPALDQPLLPVQQALFNFRNWIVEWEKRPEDFVCQVNATSSWLRAKLSLVLSPSGLAFANHGDSPDGSPELKYAVVFASDKAAFYSPSRKRKFVATGLKHGTTASLNVSIHSRPSGCHSFNLSAAAGINSAEGEAFKLALDLPPAVLVAHAEHAYTQAEISQGKLVLTRTNREDNTSLYVSADATTGRLLHAHAAAPEGTLSIRAEEGAFARLLNEIAAVSAKHPNDYVPDHGASSFLAFMAADIVEPDNSLLIKWLDSEKEDAAPESNQQFRRFFGALKQARGFLREKDFASVFEPLNNLWIAKPDVPDEQRFFIPISPGSASTYQTLAAGTLSWSDSLFARNSWPWTLARQTVFSLVGEARHTDAELNRLAASESLGPLGCLATAFLVGKIDPQPAREFAERGTARLSPAGFRKDYDILLNTNCLVGQVLNNALALFGRINSSEVDSLVTGLQPGDANFLRDLAKDLRGSPDRPPSATGWNAVQRHWDTSTWVHLASALKSYLPTSHDLTNPVALYKRGAEIMSQKTRKPDTAEALRCFQKAADQGYPRAQVAMGRFCEQGEIVRQDFLTAMAWYLKASAQNEPHAACRVADLYYNGKGVGQNFDEAAKWYRIDAERSCTHSQFKLAESLEQKGEAAESLKWLRKAAEGGHVGAQAKLGNLFSDDVFGTPDYVEACVWLGLAAENGHKLSEIRLRRFRTKLTREQRHDFERKLGLLMPEAVGDQSRQ